MAARLDPLTNPRGHLPARVYWTRRALVLGLPLLLLVVLISMLTGGGDPSPKARLAGATEPTTSTAPRPSGPSGPVAVTTTAAAPGKKAGKKAGKKGRSHPAATPTAVPLAAPDGPCAADEITVQPAVDHARAGGSITIAVQLRTARPACTFEVSPSSLAVKVTSGSDGIWSTQDCRKAVPHESVVVRSAKPALVPVTWNGRRITDGTCGPTNGWARPGYYHALAAVIGSEPSDVQFRLSLPPRPVVTKTAHPKPRKTTRSSHAGSTGTTTGAGSACGGDNAATSC
ncbi:MAG: hypothetical protein ACTHNS_08760 [Marmoricola sp.]